MKRLVVLSVLLAGCAQAQWARKDTAAAQVRDDLAACQDAAYREANAKPLPYPTMGPVILQDSSGKRFNADRGGPFADPEGVRYTRELRLTDECMRKKGYERAAPR